MNAGLPMRKARFKQACGLCVLTKRSFPLLQYPFKSTRNFSSEEQAAVFRPVGQDDFVDHLSAAGAFPCFKRPYEIIILLGKHPAFVFWTIHGLFPLLFVALMVVCLRELQQTCQYNPLKDDGLLQSSYNFIKLRQLGEYLTRYGPFQLPSFFLQTGGS